MAARASGRASGRVAAAPEGEPEGPAAERPARGDARARGAPRKGAPATGGGWASPQRRRAALAAGLLALWALGGCGGGLSGQVGRACMAGGRAAATPELCSCIQGVANQTLSRSDQTRAARLLEAPHLAQAARDSHHPADERFWRLYATFAERSEALCS